MRAENLFSHKPFIQILNVINDGLYFADKNGTTLWLNTASEKLLNLSKEQLIGRNVVLLENEGIMKPSVTRMVMESRSTVNTLQTSFDGRKYLVTGHLIHLSDGDEIIVTHSRDITKSAQASNQLEETELLLKRYIQEIKTMKLKEERTERKKFSGKDENFKLLIDLIEKAAGVDTTVLITGETGVGKTAVAKQIHHLSDRHDHPFVHINCGAIPETLLESELFGYKKGSFTGANANGKTGLVKMADKGTLFLDEVGELPLHMQPKLLQLLQNKTFLPIGELTVQKVDVRIITATNKDLLDMTDKGAFREDLYYRLNILPVHVPALRERKEDIFHLLQLNLDFFNNKYSKTRRFNSLVVDAFQDYDWPGNIRELENLVERLVITSQSDEINITDLPSHIKTPDETKHYFHRDANEPLLDFLSKIEKEIIMEALEKNKTTRKTAEVLGLTQSALMRRLKKYV